VNRRRLRVLAAVALASAAPNAADAALLTLSGSTLTVSVWSLPTVSIPQNVAALPILVSSGGGFTEPGNLFTGTVMLPSSMFTGVPLVNGFTVALFGHASKYIAPSAPGGSRTGIQRPGGGLGGSGPLSGRALINVLALFNLVVPLFPVGDTYGSSISNQAGIMVTVLGTAWTTGNVTLTGLSGSTPGQNTVTFDALGFDNRTPGHAGVLQLVSPFKVVDGVAGAQPGYALQTLTFAAQVPEPGTLVLLVSGAAGLVAYGLSKRRPPFNPPPTQDL
jgi:hypothetical protein